MPNAIVKACNAKTGVKNTGKECDTAMGAAAMLIAIAPSVTWTQTDLNDPYNWLNNLIHARKAFPLFGQNAPIRTINNNAESDVIITLDDGLQVFVRYGIYNRIFETTSGGFCYAQSLMSFNRSGYRIIEIDKEGQMLFRKNQDKTYSGLIIDFMYAPSPILADLKSTPYKNRFQLSYSPSEVVNNGIIFEGAGPLLSMMGLIDSDINDAGLSSTNTLNIGITTDCAETDLVDVFKDKFNSPLLFVVTNKATGAVIPITGVTRTGSTLHLAGTFVAGTTYTVSETTPAALKTALIEGYELTGSVDITV